MTCLGVVNENIAWKTPHCGSCTLGDAILVCLFALCWGRVSSGPTGGAGAQARPEQRSVDVFVPAARRCAVHFSTSEPSGGSGDRSRGSASAPAPDPLPNTQRSSHRYPPEAAPTARKATLKRWEFARSWERIKLMKAVMITGSELSSRPCSINPGWAYLGLFAFPSCAVCVLSDCRMGCLRSAERTSLFTGCWASLRRWCRFITGRFSVSRCGQLLLRSPLLPPLPDMSYYHLCDQLAISLCA